MKGLEDPLDKISKWICTTVSSEIGMKPEEALTTDGISTALYGIQNEGWKLHKNTCTGPVLCCFPFTHKHTHTRIYSGQTWPSSDLNISGHAALWVPTGHIVSKCHNPETEGWKWVEGQGDQMKTGGGGNQREEHSKAKGVCSVCPRRRSERQRPSHYFRVCGSRQQTLRATNPAFTATYWGMRRGANTGENIVYYWETSGNGVLSVFSASVVLKRITLNI